MVVCLTFTCTVQSGGCGSHRLYRRLDHLLDNQLSDTIAFSVCYEQLTLGCKQPPGRGRTLHRDSVAIVYDDLEHVATRPHNCIQGTQIVSPIEATFGNNAAVESRRKG